LLCYISPHDKADPFFQTHPHGHHHCSFLAHPGPRQQEISGLPDSEVVRVGGVEERENERVVMVLQIGWKEIEDVGEVRLLHPLCIL